MDWINVNERLPQKTELLIVNQTTSIEHVMDVLDMGGTTDKIKTVKAAFYDQETKEFCFPHPEGGFIAIDNVTHWMHLPEPPKE